MIRGHERFLSIKQQEVEHGQIDVAINALRRSHRAHPPAQEERSPDLSFALYSTLVTG